MRLSIKRSLAGLFVAGALTLSAVGAEAMGGGNANGPDAYIGIVGGSPQERHSQAYNYYGGGYSALGPTYQNGHGGYGYGAYGGGDYRGY